MMLSFPPSFTGTIVSLFCSTYASIATSCLPRGTTIPESESLKVSYGFQSYPIQASFPGPHDSGIPASTLPPCNLWTHSNTRTFMPEKWDFWAIHGLDGLHHSLYLLYSYGYWLSTPGHQKSGSQAHLMPARVTPWLRMEHMVSYRSTRPVTIVRDDGGSLSLLGISIGRSMTCFSSTPSLTSWSFVWTSWMKRSIISLFSSPPLPSKWILNHFISKKICLGSKTSSIRLSIVCLMIPMPRKSHKMIHGSTNDSPGSYIFIFPFLTLYQIYFSRESLDCWTVC